MLQFLLASRSGEVVVGMSISSATVFLLGSTNQLFIALCIFVLLDYVTGTAAAFWEGRKTGKATISSRIGFWGLIRKTMVFAVVIVAHWTDMAMGNQDGFIRNAALMMILANEGISILENVARMGVKIPKPLRDALVKLNDTAENNGKQND